MTLSKAQKGKTYIFESFNDSFEYKSLLVGVGLSPGDSFYVVASSFLGSPITIKLENGQLFGLRKSEAELINVRKSA